jgi:hypothetical protein
MWMTTGMAPMMPPGGHQPQFMGMGLDSSCMPPATQVPSQMQSVPPFMNNLLQTQMPGVSPAATSVTDVANQVQKSSVAGPWNPFFHPNDATAATPEVIVHCPKFIPRLLMSTFGLFDSDFRVAMLCRYQVCLAMRLKWHIRMRSRSYLPPPLLQLRGLSHHLPPMEPEQLKTPHSSVLDVTGQCIVLMLVD